LVKVITERGNGANEKTLELTLKRGCKTSSMLDTLPLDMLFILILLLQVLLRH
jgi:hypothetical protein